MINCIIPKEKEYSLEETRQKLDDVFKRLESEFLHLKQFGYFTKNERESWFIYPDKLNGPDFTSGESEHFRIDIYKNVVIFGCLEFFSALYNIETNISDQLLKIITEVAKIFRDSNCILIGAGGIGVTEYVIDMGYYQNADFEQICSKMVQLNGNPARNLKELKNKLWYLKK